MIPSQEGSGQEDDAEGRQGGAHQGRPQHLHLRQERQQGGAGEGVVLVLVFLFAGCHPRQPEVWLPDDRLREGRQQSSCHGEDDAHRHFTQQWTDIQADVRRRKKGPVLSNTIGFLHYHILMKYIYNKYLIFLCTLGTYTSYFLNKRYSWILNLWPGIENYNKFTYTNTGPTNNQQTKTKSNVFCMQ